MGGSRQDTKIQNDKYMPFVMNLMIICHVNHLGTEMIGNIPIIVPKNNIEMLTKFFLQSNYRMSNITV